MAGRRSTGEKRDGSLTILRGIWNEIKVLNKRVDRTREELGTRIDQTNQRLDQTNQRLDQTNQRLDQTNQRLDRLETVVEHLAGRQVEAETRLATELLGVARAVGEVKELLKERLDLRDRVDDLDRRVTILEHTGS